MTTFTLPLNARLVSESAYTASGYTFPQHGHIPATFVVPITYADVSTVTSITTNALVVPSGYTIENVRFVASTLFTGTSVATTELKVGNGAIANQASILSTMDIKTAYVGTANTNTTGVLGVTLAADTTLTYTVSVSGVGATQGVLSAGAGNLFVTLGVPYNTNTRP